jgi:hypothetical protein
VCETRTGGMPMIEIPYLEEPAPDQLYEFAFAAASLK